MDIIFDQLNPNSTVKIFTLSAHWVKTLAPASSSGSTTWNRANDSGSLVASGIYIYLVTDTQGRHARGRLAIIR